MKKKLCLVIAFVCCVAVFVVAFAACNDEREGKVDLDEKFLSARRYWKRVVGARI